MNFDGSMNLFRQMGGIGGITRNDKGELLLAYAGATQVGSAEEAELQALGNGINLRKTLQPSRLQIEGDCHLLVSSLQMQQTLS